MFLQTYDELVDVSLLSPRGIDVLLTQAGAQWFVSCRALELPPYATKASMNALVTKITDVCVNGSDVTLQVPDMPDQFPTDVQVAVLVAQ